MFQSYMLFEAYTYHPGFGEGNQCSKRVKSPNSTMLSEGDEATATCLGQRTSKGGILIIHRASSVEEATATCLGNSTKYKIFEFSARKSAPNELFLFLTTKTRR